MNNRSCQRGMPEWAAGFNARRERKNEVDMMSKVKPCLRAMASPFGTFGVSMNPNRSTTRRKVSPTGSMCTRSAASTRGDSSVWIVRMTFFSCSTL